jgi:hypothetical protein
MPEPQPESTFRRWLFRALWLLAALAGLKFGFDFGVSIGGPWMGFAMAITSAIFCTMMAEGIAEWLLRADAARRDRT